MTTTRSDSPNSNPPVVVVGAGLGGLSAACTLAARGYRVVVLERNRWNGGKAAVLEEGGYRFDMGPTILLMPSVLRRIFLEAGVQLEEALPMVKLDPQWRAFFDDGTTLDLTEDTAAMEARIDAFAPGRRSGNGYRNLLAVSERLHGISDRYFFWRSIGGFADMVDVKSALRPSLLADLMALRPGRSVASTIRSFVPDARVAQMLDHMVQYVGSAPDESPAVLCAIAHMQTSEGVWYPIGGTGAVARALAALAQRLGVEFRHEVLVKRIVVSDGRVTHVELESVDGAREERMPAAAVVSNGDSVRTHRELIGGGPARAFEARRRYEPACSGVVLYCGLDTRFDHLAHHDFVFSRDPEEEFESIYRKGEPAPDPTCYLCAPARTEPDVAPPGGESLYVLVHAPYLREGQDWGDAFPRYRRVIFDKLARTAHLTNLEAHIRVERWLTPDDIRKRYRVWKGAIYGLASHGRFTGAFKPPNRSPDVRGLYFAGGSVHPGPGMPMVLMSGWIAADSLDKDGVAGVARRGATATRTP